MPCVEDVLSNRLTTFTTTVEFRILNKRRRCVEVGDCSQHETDKRDTANYRSNGEMSR